METELLYALVALFTGTGLGTGGMFLRGKRNNNHSNYLLRDIHTELTNIRQELSDLRVAVARLDGTISARG